MERITTENLVKKAESENLNVVASLNRLRYFKMAEITEAWEGKQKNAR